MWYAIPASLDREIDDLETLIERYRRGECEAGFLKAHRVPFGIYEQRQKGTYMVRVRCPAGVIAPDQLGTVAALSTEFGSGIVHLTTRQELQIHEVAIENLINVVRRLRNANLSTRGGGGNTVRNIVGSPESGISEDEVFDVTPYVLALTNRLTAEPDSWTLPRKYKIAFSCSSKDTGHARCSDLGFIATIAGTTPGFKVYVAGGLGAKSQAGHLLHEFVPAGDVYVIAKAIKRLFDQYGNRKDRHSARLRFLWNQLGETDFIARYRRELDAVRETSPEPPLLPQIPSPPARSDRFGSVVEDNKQAGESNVENRADEFDVWRRRYVTSQRQRGFFAVLLPVFVGNIDAAKTRDLARFLAPLGKDAVRVTFGQNLLLRNIPEAQLNGLFALAKRLSDLSTAPPVLGHAIACTGADTCQLGLCLSKGALNAVRRRLTSSGLDLDALGDFRLHISGCPNNCGQHSLADLGFSGKAARKDQRLYPAYKISVGGGRTDEHGMRLAEEVGEISARDLPDLVAELLADYIARRSQFRAFWDYFDAEGRHALARFVERLGKVPSFEDDKNYYFDWGASEVFSLVGKGTGECSAGLFDLIELDRQRIRMLREQLRKGEAVGSAHWDLCVSTARMLLVTRGVEPSSDGATLQAFRTHFIDEGLVDRRFDALIRAGLARDAETLRALESELLALADAVESLYARMDASLRFAPESADGALANESAERPAASLVGRPERVRDYRGVACPMNFVKVKLALDTMSAGEILRVLLDTGAPIENVPRSVAAEGHDILEQGIDGDHAFVVIRKAQ